MKVAAIQHDIVWEDREATLAALEPQLAQAAAGGASLAVCAEMFATGFSMATDRTAEPPDGPTVTWMSERAAAHELWLAGSVAERAPGAELPSNTFVVAGPGGQLHRYRKLHPFSYAGEHERFAPGDEVVTLELDGVRVTPFVCYDLRFADVFWHAARDTDVYLVVANWPAARRAHWTTLLRARAIENQAYVVGVGRVVEGIGIAYAGDSQVIDPSGEVLVAAANDPTVLTAELDPEVVAAARDRYPFLADRRSG